MNLTDEAMDVVNTFIENGGHFIAWFVGHTHSDELYLFKKQNYTKPQLVIHVASPKNDGVGDVQKSSNVSDYSYHLFNYVGIDTYKKHIKIMRMGMNYDIFMRARNTLMLNYNASTAADVVISES
jgi:hypothetical protein